MSPSQKESVLIASASRTTGVEAMPTRIARRRRYVVTSRVAGNIESEEPVRTHEAFEFDLAALAEGDIRAGHELAHEV